MFNSETPEEVMSAEMDSLKRKVNEMKNTKKKKIFLVFDRSLLTRDDYKVKKVVNCLDYTVGQRLDKKTVQTIIDDSIIEVEIV